MRMASPSSRVVATSRRSRSITLRIRKCCPAYATSSVSMDGAEGIPAQTFYQKIKDVCAIKLRPKGQRDARITRLSLEELALTERVITVATRAPPIIQGTHFFQPRSGCDGVAFAVGGGANKRAAR